jgi:hypothetical protein
MGNVLVGLSRERAILMEKCRAELEASRNRQSIEVPGLSKEASAAVMSLRNAGAYGQPRHETGQMADVAAVWVAIQGNQPVCDELARFERAAFWRWICQQMGMPPRQRANTPARVTA